MSLRIARPRGTRKRRAVLAGVLSVAAVGGVLALAPASPASAAPACNTYMDYYGASYPAYNGVSIDCELGPNMTGYGVLALQRSLNMCYGQGLTLDGIYGPRTTAAVKLVQGMSGLVQDGWYGPQTRDRMGHATSNPYVNECYWVI